MLKHEKWCWTVDNEMGKHVVSLDNTGDHPVIYVDGKLKYSIDIKKTTPNCEFCFDIGGTNCTIFLSRISSINNGYVKPKFIVNDFYTDEKDFKGNPKKYYHVPDKDVMGQILLIFNLLIFAGVAIYSLLGLNSEFHIGVVLLSCFISYIAVHLSILTYKIPRLTIHLNDKISLKWGYFRFWLVMFELFFQFLAIVIVLA